MKSKTSGASKKGKKTPRYAEHNARGTDNNPFSKQRTRTELLARMKAAAEARKATDQAHSRFSMNSDELASG